MGNAPPHSGTPDDTRSSTPPPPQTEPPDQPFDQRHPSADKTPVPKRSGDMNRPEMNPEDNENA